MPIAEPKPKIELLPGEHEDIREDVRALFSNADEWMDAPSPKFHFRKPNDLIGTPDERLIRDMLRQILYVGMT
ncbi:MAG: hypothetical protein M3Y28_11210 [Armatimonadota bacterium]|nr:hypothetical protein [Armatimonadota bacterium]